MRINITAKVTKDTKVWDRVVRNLSRPSGVVDTGWWGNRHPTGASVAQVAAWNEEGYVTGWGGWNPPRPFVRVDWMYKVRKEILPKYAARINEVAIGRLSWNALNREMAKDLKDAMQKVILDYKSPPNKASTIAIKGHDEVLIDTGTMYDRVKTRIRRNRT